MISSLDELVFSIPPQFYHLIERISDRIFPSTLNLNLSFTSLTIDFDSTSWYLYFLIFQSSKRSVSPIVMSRTPETAKKSSSKLVSKSTPKPPKAVVSEKKSDYVKENNSRIPSKRNTVEPPGFDRVILCLLVVDLLLCFNFVCGSNCT